MIPERKTSVPNNKERPQQTGQLRTELRTLGRTIFVAPIVLGTAALQARDEWINFGLGASGEGEPDYEESSPSGKRNDGRGKNFDEAVKLVETALKAQKKAAERDYKRAKRRGDQKGMEAAQADLDRYDSRLKGINTGKNVKKWTDRIFGSDDE